MSMQAVSARAAVIVLVAIAVSAAGLVMAVDGLLAEARAHARQEALRAKLREVPMPAYDNDPVQDRWPVAAAQSSAVTQVLRARREGRPVGVYMTVRAAGYAGDMRLLVGVRADGVVTGARVLEEHETHGFGDRIEQEDAAWVQGFTGRALADGDARMWDVRKDGGAFDALSGATVTSRGVIRAVHEALLYFEAHREEIFTLR